MRVSVTYNILMPFFIIFLLTFVIYWESQFAKDRLWKKLHYIFLRIIDINDKFNVRRTISYYNVKHIKDNIYEAKAKWNYFWLVTLKTVRELRLYDIGGTLDKQYVLASYHSFVKFGQRIIAFLLHINLQYWIRQHQLVIEHRLKQELISILRYFCNK